MKVTCRLCAPALTALFLGLSSPVGASETDYAARVAATIETVMGAPLSAEDRAAVTADVTRTLKANPNAFRKEMTLLESMAELSQNAHNPATRLVMEDMHRQLLETTLYDPDNSTSTPILDRRNPFINESYNGLGLSRRDLNAAAILETLAVQMPDDPADFELDEKFTIQTMERLIQLYADENDANRQVITRLDAWAAGVFAAWPNLTPEQRKSAALFTFVEEPPGHDVMEAVIGTKEFMYWLAGMDVPMTPEERKAHPEMVYFIEDGAMTGGMTDIINRHLMREMAGGMGGANLGTVTSMQNLNYELLWNDLSSGSIAGTMGGFE